MRLRSAEEEEVVGGRTFCQFGYIVVMRMRMRMIMIMIITLGARPIARLMKKRIRRLTSV
jgi:hypothetical protein